jgi:hypothetical protein
MGWSPGHLDLDFFADLQGRSRLNGYSYLPNLQGETGGICHDFSCIDLPRLKG